MRLILYLGVLFLVSSFDTSNAQCSSANKTIYIKSDNMELRSAALATLTSISLEQCSKKCTEYASSSMLDSTINGSQTCSIRTESAQPYGTGILSTAQQPQTAFYQKICVQSDRLCNTVNVFDWYPQNVLVGFSMEVLRAVSTSECLQLCLEFGAVNKLCKSVMYFYDTRECVINSESRTSRPNLFGNDTQGFVVDYFDNNCATTTERPSSITGPITCTPPARLQYTLVENKELQGQGEISSQNVDATKCQMLCDSNQDERGQPVRCRGYSYDRSSQICYLSGDLTAPRGESTFVDRQNLNYYEKVCLAYAQQCSQQPIFTRYPSHVLVGYAREVYRFSSVADCLDSCLNSRPTVSFDCLSVMYYYETGECVVNSANKDNQPSLFSGDTQALEVDYFENNCVHAKIGYSSGVGQPVANIAPAYAAPAPAPAPTYVPANRGYQPQPPTPSNNVFDPSLGVDTFQIYSTLPAPQPPTETPVHRSITTHAPPGPPTEPSIVIIPPPPPSEPPQVIIPPPPPSEPPHVILPPPPPAEPAFDSEQRNFPINGLTDNQPTHVFIFPASDSRLGPSFQSTRISVSTECLLDSVRILSTFPHSITGAIFLKNQFSTCRKMFQNASSVTFDIPLRSPSQPVGVTLPPTIKQPKSSTNELCEATLIGVNKYSWIIVIQQNDMGVPGLMTSDDQIYNITCDYIDAFTKVVPDRATFLPVGRVPASEIEAPQIPQTDAKISMELLRDGIPVTTVLLGEELELRWRIESTTPNVGFFVHDCLAERVGGSPPEPLPLRLITEGCPDPSIAGRIMPSPVIQLSHGLSTRMTMFRFDGSRSVKIKCAIDMCVQRCRPVKCIVKSQEVESLGRKRRNTLEISRPPQGLTGNRNISEYLKTLRQQSSLFSNKSAANNGPQSSVVGIFTIVDELPLSGDVKTFDSNQKSKSTIEKNDKKTNSVLHQNGQICLLKPLFVGIFTFLGLLCSIEGGIVALYCWKRYKQYKKAKHNNNNNETKSFPRSHHSDDGLVQKTRDSELRKRVFGVHQLRNDQSIFGTSTMKVQDKNDDQLNRSASRNGSLMNKSNPITTTLNKKREDKLKRCPIETTSSGSERDYEQNRQFFKISTANSILDQTTLEAVRSLSTLNQSSSGAKPIVKPPRMNKSSNFKNNERKLLTKNGSPVGSESNSSSSIDYPLNKKQQRSLQYFGVVSDKTMTLNDQPPKEIAPVLPTTTTNVPFIRTHKNSTTLQEVMKQSCHQHEYTSSNLIKTISEDINRRRLNHIVVTSS